MDSPSGTPPARVEEIERIGAIGGPALRTGPCANGCTFATWASRQAGRTIRGEDLMEELERRIGAGAEWLHPIRSLVALFAAAGLAEPRHPPRPAGR